jgi:hypothetical protein
VVESPSDTLTIHPCRRLDDHISHAGVVLVTNPQANSRVEVCQPYRIVARQSHADITE